MLLNYRQQLAMLVFDGTTMVPDNCCKQRPLATAATVN